MIEGKKGGERGEGERQWDKIAKTSETGGGARHDKRRQDMW